MCGGCRRGRCCESEDAIEGALLTLISNDAENVGGGLFFFFLLLLSWSAMPHCGVLVAKGNGMMPRVVFGTTERDDKGAEVKGEKELVAEGKEG